MEPLFGTWSAGLPQKPLEGSLRQLEPGPLLAGGNAKLQGGGLVAPSEGPASSGLWGLWQEGAPPAGRVHTGLWGKMGQT